MMSRTYISRSLFAFVAMGVVLVGCGGEDDVSGNSTSGGRAERGQSGQPGGRPQVPPIPVAVEPAAQSPIASYYAATATLEPNKEAEILARVSGVVLGLDAEEGDRVAERQTLLQIDDSEYRYRLKQAKAEHAKQLTRFDRFQKMFDGNLLSADEFETSKSDLQAAEATAELAELELSYTRVAAPFTGHIVRRHVDPGQTVTNGTALFSIADLEKLLARVHVPAKEFRSIRIEQAVELRLDSAPEPFTGKIILVSPIVDPTSGTIKVTVEIPDYPRGTRPGDFADVRIVTDQHSEALVVRRTAVVTDRGDQVVYVVSDSTAERRLVQTGFEDDRNIEITEGVAEGERVVIQGQRSLKDGSPIKIMDAIVFDDSAGSDDS